MNDQTQLRPSGFWIRVIKRGTIGHSAPIQGTQFREASLENASTPIRANQSTASKENLYINSISKFRFIASTSTSAAIFVDSSQDFLTIRKLGSPSPRRLDTPGKYQPLKYRPRSSSSPSERTRRRARLRSPSIEVVGTNLRARFWEVEEIKPKLCRRSPENEECEKHFSTTHYRLDSGRIVRKRIFLCIKCYKLKAKPWTPLMGNLPKYRLEGGRPFIHTGVDFAGPFAMRESLRRKAPVSKGTAIPYTSDTGHEKNKTILKDNRGGGLPLKRCYQ
ncbi:unnamed protein product [Nesidiocoris tenuis]|uniref:Uncharacterized protein n=1 Tax=Nesidiocoris tenuis TaxID=355587 RepID=A0A6H5G4N5_9HEMI|nr:unnamed protein product [Nesidiocoris tenuis]